MKRLFQSSLEVAVSCACIAAAASAAGRFKSPAGCYEVAFEELERKTYSKGEHQRDLNHTSYIKYRISFYRSGQPEAIAVVEYHDVYGWEKNSKATPLKDLFEAILWSPKEDFAVLDEEGWVRAPGAPDRRAVALSPGLPWSVAPFRLAEMVWADALRVIGNAHNDCDYAVEEFDGRTGETRAIKEAESPIGYEIRKVIGRQVLMHKLLDNCKTEDSERGFLPECLSLNLDTMQTTVVPCDASP